MKISESIELEAELVITSIRIGGSVFPIEAGVACVEPRLSRVDSIPLPSEERVKRKYVKHKLGKRLCTKWSGKHKIGLAPHYGKSAVWREDVEAIERCLSAPGMQMLSRNLVKATGLNQYQVNKTLDYMRQVGRVSLHRLENGNNQCVYYIPEGARQVRSYEFPPDEKKQGEVEKV